ncbi:MAG: nickel pincer cofactor biosynthesis protein LarC [Oscillospiraceae bacterium]|nr:nickel pincer cofactor biosynthesis protein LarC [Oscillospiraceae bacterium]
MKTLYLDLGMGAAGDMLSAALLALLPAPDPFVEKLNAAGIPGVRFVKENSVKCGITGTGLRVLVNGEEEGEHLYDHEHHAHHHSGVSDIAHIVNEHLRVPDRIKKQITEIYERLAAAESRVHGVPVTDVHFHEVGTMDALADITAVCVLIDELSPEKIAASPVHVGAGHVKCAHGVLPVPAPATAEILKGVPVYGGEIKSELCTPTGAVLLKYFVDMFGDMPVMNVERIGYGMGKKDFETANCVRALLGECKEHARDIIELSFNVDDMTAEEIGFAMDVLYEKGAKEVFTVPVGMKKNRPGTLICVLCEAERRNEIVAAVFKHTTTIGIRENPMKRYLLERDVETLETPLGTVRKKTSHGFGIERSKIEYDDLARIAKENGISLREARRIAEKET